MRDLTKGNIYKTFFSFGLPLVLAGLLTQCYSIIDGAIAGRFLGEVGLAATSATQPLVTFISSLFWGFSVGFSIYTTRLFAAKKYHKLKSTFYTFLVVIILFGFTVGGGLIAFYKPLASLLNIDKALLWDAFLYFVVVNAGNGIIVLGAFFIYTLNGMGVSGYTFWMSLLSGVLNVVGNILSVTVLGMGVVGIALSTVLSSLVVNVAYFIKIRSCFKKLEHGEEKVKFKLATLKPSFSYAFPNMLQQGVMYLVGLLISPLVNGIGIAATASYAVVLHVYNLIAAVYQNSTRSVNMYTAQCIGSKQYDKIKKGVFAGLLQGFAFATPFIIACCVFHKQICGIFFKADASAETKEYAYSFVKYYLPFIYFNVVNNLFHAFYRGVKAMGHLFAMTFFGSIVRYVLCLICIPPFGMDGFYLGWVISWIAEAIATTFLYFFGKWKKALPSIPEQVSSGEKPQEKDCA